MCTCKRESAILDVTFSWRMMRTALQKHIYRDKDSTWLGEQEPRNGDLHEAYPAETLSAYQARGSRSYIAMPCLFQPASRARPSVSHFFFASLLSLKLIFTCCTYKSSCRILNTFLYVRRHSHSVYIRQSN